MAINNNGEMEVVLKPKIDQKSLQKAEKEMSEFIYTLSEKSFTDKSGKTITYPTISSPRFTGLLNSKANGFVLEGDQLSLNDLVRMYNNNGLGRQGTASARSVIESFFKQLCIFNN